MTQLDVYVDDAGATRLVGQAFFTRGRNLSTTFMYDSGYIAAGGMNIDPALRLVAGPQYQTGLLRAFADSAPDRWGRNIIDQAERVAARAEERVPRRLDDVNYLLGVNDDTRQGALRFRHPGQKAYIAAQANVPKLVALPHLLRRSDELAKDDDAQDAVKELLDTGTTGLGGARPKASVRLDDGALAIAKFPHSSDQWDVMAWEATSLELLSASGIAVPGYRLARLGERSVLLLRRFDRGGTQERIGYISAMTATGSGDGEHRDYADVADAIRDIARSPKQSHRELYDRVVASVALGNTDDHLRNHGFLAQGGAWVLSPAFDVNPNPDLARRRSTSIAGADTYEDEVDGLLAFASDCDLSQDEARDRIGRVAEALTDWDAVARSNGVREREVSRMRESIGPRLEKVQRAGRRVPRRTVVPAPSQSNSGPVRRKTTSKSTDGSFASREHTPPEITLDDV